MYNNSRLVLYIKELLPSAEQVYPKGHTSQHSRTRSAILTLKAQFVQRLDSNRFFSALMCVSSVL